MKEEKIFIKSFEELSVQELYALLKLRVDVFVVEQNCPYHELDGKDQQALHVFFKEGEEILAYLRILPKGILFPQVAIGRVIAAKRGAGLGRKIVEAGILAAKEKFLAGDIRVDAQSYAQGFYEKLGFQPITEEFFEDGIAHVGMIYSA